MNRTRERLLASTMIVGALTLFAGKTAAQTVQTAPPSETAAPPSAPSGGGEATPATPAAPPTAVKEVVVTGSRIPQPGLTSASPLTVVNDQEIKLEGTTNVEDLLNNLPQAVAEQTSQVSNGATGTATANLRGLGSNKTLVLIDGRRLMPGDPIVPVPDLNVIPVQLVDRVEVTTGGASAIYGSDAVAGVVNFIMKRDFQGVRIDVQGGFFQSGNGGNGDVRSAITSFNTTAANPIGIPGGVVDGRKIDVTAIFGANSPDDKGNVTAYVEYRNEQPVTQSNRLGSACAISTIPSGKTNAAGNIYDTHVCQGSSNSAYGHFTVSSITSPTGSTLAGTPATLSALGVAAGPLSNNPNGSNTFVPYSNALSYNFGPLNYFQREDDRYTAGFFAHYNVNKHFDLYSDFLFNDDDTVAQTAPSGLFQGRGPNNTSTVAVNCDNPLLSASQASALCGSLAGSPNLANLTAGYRFTTGGPRQSELRHTEYKIDIGSRGEIAPGWNYDAYLQYGTSLFEEEFLNDVSLNNLQAALLVNPLTGACSGGQSGCAPANLFQFGGLSKGALGYVSVPGFQRGQTTEQVASASITGDLGQYGVKSPLANDGIGLALGAEYRRESLSFNVDQEFATGDLSGQGGPILSTSGSYDVYELFGEVRVPLIQDKPFIRSLAFDGAYRFSQYSTAGKTDTFEAQLTYAVNRDISFRGGFNRAVRAPNVDELFTPQAVALFSGSDPCAGTSPTATLAACQRTGVTSGQYGTGQIQQCPSSQCSELAGGNTHLSPERADTYTLGLVFTPTESFLRGFTLTADWFDIDVKNIIIAGVGGPDVTLAQCLQTGSPVYCSLIHRDPTSGNLFGNNGYVVATNVNTGFLRTEGVDFEANYRMRLSDYGLDKYGSLSFNMDGTYTYEYVEQPVSGGGTFNCEGQYGSDKCILPRPRWRHKVRMTWTPPMPFTLSFQWRFIDSLRFDGNSANPFLSQGVYNAADAKLPVMNYLDISATYRIRDGLTARFGVNNVLDANAPVVDSNVFPASGPAFGNGNTFPGLYDALGREFFFGVTLDL
jgi:outer membrane receptor protein involved in Fe transport